MLIRDVAEKKPIISLIISNYNCMYILFSCVCRLFSDVISELYRDAIIINNVINNVLNNVIYCYIIDEKLCKYYSYYLHINFRLRIRFTHLDRLNMK